MMTLLLGVRASEIASRVASDLDDEGGSSGFKTDALQRDAARA
jgi:hypothetical protein